MYKLIIFAALVAVCAAGALHSALVSPVVHTPVTTTTHTKYTYVSPSAHVSRVDYSYYPVNYVSSHLDVGSPYYASLVSPYVYSYVPLEYVPVATGEKKPEKTAEEPKKDAE